MAFRAFTQAHVEGIRYVSTLNADPICVDAECRSPTTYRVYPIYVHTQC